MAAYWRRRWKEMYPDLTPAQADRFIALVLDDTVLVRDPKETPIIKSVGVDDPT